MKRKIAALAVVALLVAGTSAVLAGDAGPAATDGATLAQDEETTTAEDVPGENETTTEEMDGTTTAEEPASVTFLNQTAGITFVNETANDTTVMIERAVLPEGGYVVIHAAENVSGEYEQAENVTIGAVLGNSTYLEPGDHANVVIQLDRPLNESQTLVAMAHRDTNANQQYDFPEADEPYTFMGSPVTQSGYVIVTDAAGQMIEGNQTATEEEMTTEEETTTEA